MDDKLKSFEEMLKKNSTEPKATSFEEQLKKSLEKKETDNDLKKFEEQLKNGLNTQSDLQTGPQQQRKIKTVKNLVISYRSDFSGCGFIRNVTPFSFLDSVFGKTNRLQTIISPQFLFQQDLLVRAKSLFFQRSMSPEHLKVIEYYKKLQQKFKFKMVWDIDDFIWGKNELQGGMKEDGVPSYNFGYRGISKEVKNASVEIMKLMDTCCFSTEYLRDYAVNTFNLKNNCIVVPNAVPKFFWGDEKRKDITEKIKKPKVLYSGSPTHYSNAERKLGDFENAWKDWIIESVKNDKIEFTVMGGLPWFFAPIKDKITVIDWVNSFAFHNTVKKVNADIGIMPLVRNNFNYSKSDIKYLELCSLGIIGIGTTFTNNKPSPYDVCEVQMPDNCTVEDIQAKVDEICEPDIFNYIKNEQYNWMDKEGRWTESPKYVNLLTSIL